MAHREEGLELRIGRARKTMIVKANSDLHPLHPSEGVANSSPVTTPTVKTHNNGTILMTNLSTPTEDSTSTPEKETVFSHNTSPLSESKPDNGSPSISGQQTPKRKHKKVATSKLYSIVIFDEFLKELAAISQEQSIVSPALYHPNDDDDDVR